MSATPLARVRVLREPDEPTISTAPHAPARGAATSSRVHGVDLARGLALLGMMLVHSGVTVGEDTGAIAARLLTLPYGQAAVLFVTISGVALSIIASRASASASSTVLRRRGTILLFFGLAFTVYFAPSILQHYGVLFLVAPWLLAYSTRTLIAVTAAAFTVGAVLVLVLSTGLTIDATQLSSTPEYLVQHILVMFTQSYALLVWIGFFTSGLIIGRLDLGSARTAGRLVVGGVLVAVAVTAAATAAGALWDHDPMGSDTTVSKYAVDPTVAASGPASVPAEDVTSEKGASGEFAATSGEPTETELRDWWASINAEPEAATESEIVELRLGEVQWSHLLSLEGHSNATAWAIKAQAVAAVLLGLCLLLMRSRVGVIGRPIAIAGSMTLTAYLLHVVLVTDVWGAVGTSTLPFITDSSIRLLLLLQVLLLAGSVGIHARWGRGPAERLLGWLARH